MIKKIFFRSLVVTASSNINIYSNLSENNSINGYFGDNLLIKKQPDNSSTAGTDAFVVNTTKPNNSYFDEIQSKVKQNKNNSNSNEKSPEEKKEIENLEKTDQKVRAHEQAHLAAGAGLVRGGASFEYTRGPDGKMYAVGGEVKIDISPVNGKPDETIRKMQRVVAAALAPVDPSPQDRAVATIARNMQAKAQMEKSEEARKATQTKESTNPNESSTINQKNDNSQTISKSNEQKKDKVDTNYVIKKYIINNPYQKLDRILFKSV